MKFSDNSCQEFISVLASKQAVPGGGGAAALCAAIGTALGNMVGALTAGKKKYADVEDEILQLNEDCQKLETEFLEFIEKDAQCFAPLARAYALPSQTEEEKLQKEKMLEECSKNACLVPLELMEKCAQAICLTERYTQIGSRLAISDAGCAASILRAALQAASLNIFINTAGIKDREFADAMNQKANDLLREYGEKAEQLFQTVLKNLQNK